MNRIFQIRVRYAGTGGYHLIGAYSTSEKAAEQLERLKSVKFIKEANVYTTLLDKPLDIDSE